MDTRNSANMTDSERLLALYAILMFEDRSLTRAELAGTLACAPHAVSRALAKVAEAGFGTLVKGKSGRFSTYRLEAPEEIPTLVPGADGLGKLALCRAFLMHLLPERVRASVNAAQPAGHPVRESIDYQPFLGTIETLLTAIRLHRVCDIHCLTAPDGEEKSYVFAPQKLVTRHNAIHARGWTVSASGMAYPLTGTPTELPVHLMTHALPTSRGAEHLPDVDQSREGFGLMEEGED